MKNNFISFENFERAVIKKLLEGNDPIKIILRKQYEKAQVESRQFSGKGFFTSFKISQNAPILPNAESFHVGDVIGKVNDTLVDFVLFIENGILTCLEGVVLGDAQWPNKIMNYELNFADKDNVVSFL